MGIPLRMPAEARCTDNPMHGVPKLAPYVAEATAKEGILISEVDRDGTA